MNIEILTKLETHSFFFKVFEAPQKKKKKEKEKTKKRKRDSLGTF
jgi:hypothetical protein